EPGVVEACDALPSFLYLPAPGEMDPAALALPWGAAEHVVGTLARARGAEVPGRVVASAKSWLCATGVDPSGPILPWGAPDDVPRLSPVAAEAQYLAHLRAAWDAAMPAPLAEQEVYLAVPASFDAVARELTVRAAEAAGLGGARLIEEPQAAFYAWIAASRGAWRQQVQVGDVILVCDVGGGTTDLSLVSVGEEAGALVLERRAVGDHILLGGDNMDLALAHAVRARLAETGVTLDDWQLRGLVHGCRQAKERLLAADGPERAPVLVLGRSRKVVGGALSTEVTRAQVERTLVEGFFPLVAADAQPARARRAGLQEIGLPYAADPAITRHVAAFLARHREVAPEGPSAVLFNGGVTGAARLRARLTAARPARCACLRARTRRARWRSAPRPTGLRAAAGACASAAGRRAPTTSAWRRRRRPCPACPRRSRRSASRPSAWRRAARSSSPTRSSGSSWASRRSFASSAPRCGATTGRARWSRAGRRASSRSCGRSRRRLPPRARRGARCRCGSART